MEPYRRGRPADHTIEFAMMECVARKPDRKGRMLGEGQADALVKIAVSGRVIDVLVGLAGAGKTTAMSALRRAWEPEHGKGSVVGLARTIAAYRDRYRIVADTALGTPPQSTVQKVDGARA